MAMKRIKVSLAHLESLFDQAVEQGNTDTLLVYLFQWAQQAEAELFYLRDIVKKLGVSLK